MSEWIKREDEKPLVKGYMRLYSFKPVTDSRFKLGRCYEFSRAFGNREWDMYIDIPFLLD